MTIKSLLHEVKVTAHQTPKLFFAPLLSLLPSEEPAPEANSTQKRNARKRPRRMRTVARKSTLKRATKRGSGLGEGMG